MNFKELEQRLKENYTDPQLGITRMYKHLAVNNDAIEDNVIADGVNKLVNNIKQHIESTPNVIWGKKENLILAKIAEFVLKKLAN